MPDTNICVKCKNIGIPTEMGMLRKTHALGPVAWKCQACNFDWDINEDFKCIECGKEVQGRYLYCSKECEEVCEREQANL